MKELFSHSTIRTICWKFFTLIILFKCLIIQNVHSQNLVPNPSFEDTLNCSGPWNCSCTLEIASPWFNPSLGTSDYYTPYSSCGYPNIYQNPRTGNSYAGIICWLNNVREYIEIKVDSILQSGVKYCFEFYYSRSEFCGGATDRIGVYFSADSLLSNNPYNLSVVPQIETPAGLLLIDSLNWTRFSGEYIAQGGEKFITIGNFRDTANCLWQIVDSSTFLCNDAYYFIDDVSLISSNCTTSINDLFYPNDFFISFHNSILDIDYIGSGYPFISGVNCNLYSMNGKEINISQIMKIDQNTIQIILPPLNSGIYVIQLWNNLFKSNKKVFIKN